MKATKAELCEKARHILEHYNVCEDVIKGMDENAPKVFYSERQSRLFPATLYWVEGSDYESKIADFEREHNAFVFHAQLTHTTMGDMLALLFLPLDKEEWASYEDDYIYGYPLAYVENLDDEYCSEFGTIQIKGMAGGIARLA